MGRGAVNAPLLLAVPALQVLDKPSADNLKNRLTASFFSGIALAKR